MSKPIEYKWLNIDQEKLYDDEREFKESVGEGWILKEYANDYNQVLIVGCSREFTTCEAMIMCRRLAFGNITNYMDYIRKIDEQRTNNIHTKSD